MPGRKLQAPVTEEEASGQHQDSSKDAEEEGGRPPRLFEAFIVSGLAPSGEAGGKPTGSGEKILVPAMLFCFAPADVDLLQYKAVPDFSFPDQALLGRKDTKGVLAADSAARETFSFVFTDAESHRLYGFCRRYTASAGVEVACVLTRHCWYDVFSHLLDTVERTATSSTGSMGVAKLMRKVQAAGYPRPGQSLRISMDGILSFVRDLCITRPRNTSRCKYDQRLCVLFRSLPVSKAVMLFFLMLTERRVILMSNRTSKLSDCAHALSSLLYPFEWQHIYIPVLVPKMLDYVCAPMPFMIGMHIAMLPNMKQLPMEEVVMVDLDRGRLKYNEKDIAHLPDEHFDGMVNSLNHCIEHASGDDNLDWPPLANVFLDFFLCVFSGYRRFIKWNEEHASFDKEAFMKSHRKNIVKFLTEFQHSQMFEVLFSERTRGSVESEYLDDPFELAIINILGPGGSRSSSDLYGHSEERAKPHDPSSRMSNMSRFLHSMGEAVGAASPVKKGPYKPMYLRDEHGYSKGTHMLSKVYADIGLLRSAPGAEEPSQAQEGEWEEVGRMEGGAWQEQWFGPSAARWAMKQGAAGAGSVEGVELREGMLLNHMDLSEEELVQQTLYFKELNEQRRLQLEAEAAARAPNSDHPQPETDKMSLPAAGGDSRAGAGEAEEEERGGVQPAEDPLGLVSEEGGGAAVQAGRGGEEGATSEAGAEEEAGAGRALDGVTMYALSQPLLGGEQHTGTGGGGEGGVLIGQAVKEGEGEAQPVVDGLDPLKLEADLANLLGLGGSQGSGSGTPT